MPEFDRRPRGSRSTMGARTDLTSDDEATSLLRDGDGAWLRDVKSTVLPMGDAGADRSGR